MKLKYNKPSGAARKGFTLVELLVVMAIIAVLASIAVPTVLDKLKDADRTKALSQIKGVYTSIVEFESEFGTRPGQLVVDDDLVESASAANANDCFRQLIQSEKLKSEAAFNIKSLITAESDRDIGTSPAYRQALEKGENGFMYMDNPRSKPGAPLAAAPLTKQQGTFDSIAYNGKAVVLINDGEVRAIDINEDTEKVEVKIGGSLVDMFSSANKTFRSNDAPNPKYPLPR